MNWYRRSLNDHDTHCGHLRRGRVLAACGVEFSPLRALRGSALPDEPEPDKRCPECYRCSGLHAPSPARIG